MGKKLSKLSLLSLSLVAALGFANCSGDTSTQDQDNNTFDDSFTLFGYVFNATDGSRMGQDTEIYLVQGEEIRRPTRFNTDATSALVGEYAFENVPLNLYTDNSEYKVIVVKDGYQRFEGIVPNPEANDCYDVSSTDFETCNNTLDTYYNLMRDIPLFEIGETAPDITIIVRYDGELVSGATVQLDPCNGSNNDVTSDTGAHVMGFYSSSLASLTGTTDANGEVTFSGDELALGACYTPEVLPLTYETVQLATTIGTNIVEGLTNHVQVVSVTDLVPGTQDDGLYITSFTPFNADDDTVSDGTLVITFNRPIELLNPDTQFSATLNFAVTAVLEDDATEGGSVNESLSEDGLTLTLTPNYNEGDEPVTDKDDADYDSGLQVVYTGTFYILDDESYIPQTLADIEYASGQELDVLDADGTDNDLITINILPACAGCDADD